MWFEVLDTEAREAAGDFVEPAPAAGWFKRLEWRAGEGLYAVNVQWTARASALIIAREYGLMDHGRDVHAKIVQLEANWHAPEPIFDKG